MKQRVIILCLLLLGPACREESLPPAPPAPQAEAILQTVMEGLARDLPVTVSVSRKVLLGTRDPNGPSCVRQFKTGATDKGPIPPPKGDPNGGPGLRQLDLYYWNHTADSPSKDFAWHQKEFRQFVESMDRANRRVRERFFAGSPSVVGRVEDVAHQLTQMGTLEPGWGVTTTLPATDGWPERCLVELSAAVDAGDLAASRRWAAELTEAMRSLEDVHRWLALLLENQLTVLDFQRQCKEMFTAADDDYAPGEYRPPMCISRFPAGSQLISGIANFFEIERQGERMFAWPDGYVAATGTVTDVPAAIRMPPDLRATFVALRTRLSPANRAVWDHAAGAPYERTFMSNMLFRAQKAGVVDQLGEVLARFDKRHPRAEVWQLMDVLCYRAGDGMSGIEWGDRYDARLMNWRPGRPGPIASRPCWLPGGSSMACTVGRAATRDWC